MVVAGRLAAQSTPNMPAFEEYVRCYAMPGPVNRDGSAFRGQPIASERERCGAGQYDKESHQGQCEWTTKSTQ